MLTTLTLKLSPQLRKRIAREARKKGKGLQRWVMDALEREVERRERFLTYIKRAQRAGQGTDLMGEIDARHQMKFWLEQISNTHPGSKVTRLRPRNPRLSR